jgi:hypothetical protein
MFTSFRVSHVPKLQQWVKFAGKISGARVGKWRAEAERNLRHGAK